MNKSTLFGLIVTLLLLASLGFAFFTSFLSGVYEQPRSGFFAFMDHVLSPGSERDDAWRAVERIDYKLANSVVFLTVFAALIPLFIGVYEFLKVKEIEELRVRVPELVAAEVAKSFGDLERKFSGEIARSLHDRVESETAVAIKFLHDDDVQIGRAMTAYLNNELSGPDNCIRTDELIRLFEFQRQLRNLASEVEADVRDSLTYFFSLANVVSKSTSFQIVACLELVELHGGIVSLDARRHWSNVLKRYEQVHGIKPNQIRHAEAKNRI